MGKKISTLKNLKSFDEESPEDFIYRQNKNANQSLNPLLKGAEARNTPKIIIGSIVLFLIGVLYFMGGLFPIR